MKACGLIVEYNPLHNGHLHHIRQAKQQTNADVIIAIMSASFLQRGEPAIVDKVHRAKAALAAGVDLVIELPYPYAIQSSELFAKGAIFSLYEMGVTTICFGSETGSIDPFIQHHLQRNKHIDTYEQILRNHLDEGNAFPVASSKAAAAIGLNTAQFHQPNNILGLSYVNTIMNNNLPIKPFTIKRIQNDYHDENIVGQITSATSIRKELLHNHFSNQFQSTLPSVSAQLLKKYYDITGTLHTWEKYFPLLHYKVISMTLNELRNIHGINEGLEHRIKDSVNHAKSFAHWLEIVKTKRYTQTHLQRVFTHILTNTTKQTVETYTSGASVPYVRILGMNVLGQQYINQQKKQIDIPIVTRLNKKHADLLGLEEKVTDIYYSILSPTDRQKLKSAEFQLPIRKQ